MSNSIISGAYDLHVHSGPDILPRKMDDIEMAQRIVDCGMAGYAIKSHYFCTAERATLINKLFPKCNAIGTVCLNNSFGGMNALGLDIAARAGTKLVWFPTVDTEAALTTTFQLPPEKRPFWASILFSLREEGVDIKPVKVMENDKLLPEVYEVLEVIARNKMILATGHLTVRETLALVKAAHERKVERIVVTHVDWPVEFFDIEVQKELLKYGAYMEHCTNTVSSGKVDFEVDLNQIKAIGADRVVISTDLGQPINKYPDEGLLDFCNKLLQNGISEKDVRKMIVDNPRTLLNG
jgi:hypothetical protein